MTEQTLDKYSGFAVFKDLNEFELTYADITFRFTLK